MPRRKLTAKELQRKANFEELSKELKRQGYQRQDVTINVVNANVMAVFVTLPLILPLYCIAFFKNCWQISFSPSSIMLTFGALLILIVLHELIHGITWGSFTKDHWKAIDFGIIWSANTPYCACKQPLLKWQYCLGSIMPTLLLGLLPAIFALIAGSGTALFLSAIMILSGGGDIQIILKMLTAKTGTKDVIYLDHPYECGFAMFERKTIRKRK